MATRISGVTIPAEKQVQIGLRYVYGIGPKIAGEILAKAKIDPTLRVKDLNDDQVSKITEIINADYLTEGDLARVVTTNMKRLKDINCYRGLRHKNNLPSRGQRTKTNGRTRRGRRVAVAGTAKKVAAKT